MNKTDKLKNLIIESSCDDGINIGVIGEYGTGKSTYIKNEIKSFFDNEKYKVVNLSLMNSTFHGNNEKNNSLKVVSTQSELQYSSSELNSQKQNEIELLNKIINRIKFALVNRSEAPKLYQLGIHKEKKNNLGLLSLALGVILTIIYILLVLTENVYYVMEIPKAGMSASSSLRFMFLLMAGVLVSKGIYTLFLNNIIKLKKMDLELAKLELNINDDESINNFNQYEEYLLFLIEKHQQMNFKTSNYIFVFEDIDRVTESFLMNFLRETNVFLNEQTNVDTKVIFIYAIRNRLFEKLSTKKKEVPALIKQEKFFNETIIIKPYGDSYEKGIYNDIFSMKLSEKYIYEKDFFGILIEEYPNKSTEISKEYNEILKYLKLCNLEYDLDFRVYTKMVGIIYTEVNEHSIYLVENIDNIKENFKSIVYASIMMFNVKNAYEFIDIYTEYINDDRKTSTKKLDILEADMIVSYIDFSIRKRYPSKKNTEKVCLFSKREKQFLMKFVTLDYEQGNQIVENSLFSTIIGIDYEQRYFTSLSNQFNDFYNYPIKYESIEHSLKDNNKYYANEVKHKPNKYLFKSYYETLTEYLRINYNIPTSEVDREWIYKCLVNNETTNIYNKFFNQPNLTCDILKKHKNDLDFIREILKVDLIKKQLIILLQDGKEDEKYAKIISEIYFIHEFSNKLSEEVAKELVKRKEFRGKLKSVYSEEYKKVPNKKSKKLIDKVLSFSCEADIIQIVHEYNSDIRTDFFEILSLFKTYPQNYINQNLIIGKLFEDIEKSYSDLISIKELDIKPNSNTQLKTKIEFIIQNTIIF